MYIKTHLSVHFCIRASCAMKIPTCTEASFSIVSTADCHLHSFFFYVYVFAPYVLVAITAHDKSKNQMTFFFLSAFELTRGSPLARHVRVSRNWSPVFFFCSFLVFCFLSLSFFFFFLRDTH